MRRLLVSVPLGLLALACCLPHASAQPLPADTAACSMSGFAISTDRKGTPVRAEPDAKAKILGRLAPPQKAREVDKEDVPPSDEVWRTQFQIIGFKEGWFLIENALHPYDDPNRRGVLGRRSTGGVKTYAGRGWISLAHVGGKYTYYHRTMPMGALWEQPDENAKRLAAKNSGDAPIQGGNQPKKILGCAGEWVKVESPDGVTGWWIGLCGEPIGDCGKN